MDRIRSPYTFVPTSPHVAFDDTFGTGVRTASDSPSPNESGPWPQDQPYPDGLSGTFTVEVEALTPVLVRGETASGQEATFAKAPNGDYAIPGSSLRGMMRNVLEIAAFAKMGRVADRRYGVRDLHNRPLYIEKMAAIKKDRGQSVLVPQVCAAWLSWKDGDPDHDPDGDQQEACLLYTSPSPRDS